MYKTSKINEIILFFMFLFLSPALYAGLTITNLDNREKNLSMDGYPMLEYSADTHNCKHAPIGDRFWIDNSWGYGESKELPESKYACIRGHKGFTSFDTNSVENIKKCHIEIIELHTDNVRASLACKYTGNCADGLPYGGTDKGLHCVVKAPDEEGYNPQCILRNACILCSEGGSGKGCASTLE